MNNKPFIKQTTFWDYNISTIDFDKHAAFIIPRVLMHGTWEEWKSILAYYGKEIVLQHLIQTKYLDKKSLSYASFIFDIPKNQFRCFTSTQSAHSHWNY